MRQITDRSLFLLAGIILASSPVLAVENQHSSSAQLVAQTPDLSQAKITLEDLSPGFQEMPAALTKEMLESRIQGGKVPSISLFQRSGLPFGLLFAGTVLPPPGKEREIFDVLGQTLQRGIAGALPKVPGELPGIKPGVVTTQELPGVNNIGDASTGQTTIFNLQVVNLRIDMVLFRRGGVVGFVTTSYLDGDPSPAPIGDLARKLDARILRILQYSR